MAGSPVGSNEEEAEGSVAAVSERLLLWASRAGRGLCRAEYLSEHARKIVVDHLREGLRPSGRYLAEIELTFDDGPESAVRRLVEGLRETSAEVVSVVGFPVAFRLDANLERNLAPLNYFRDVLAAFELRQIWWMPPSFAERFVRAVPDLDSFFITRVRLSSTVGDLRVWLLPKFRPLRPRSEIEAERYRIAASLPGLSRPSQPVLWDELLAAEEVDAWISELSREGRVEEIEDGLRERHALLQATQPASRAGALVTSRLANLLAALGRFEEAELYFLETLAAQSELFGPNHPDAALLRLNLVQLALEQGREFEASHWLERAKGILEAYPPEEFPQLSELREWCSKLTQRLRFRSDE